MKDWYSSIYKGFIASSLVSFIIAFFTESKVSLGSYIVGYTFLILGIMMILLIIINNSMKIKDETSSIPPVLTSSGPFLLILSVISFILYLIITYKDKIIENHISSGYYTFSNIAVILLFIQIYMIYSNISTDKFQTTGRIPKVTSSFIYLIGTLSAICTVIIYTILKYFTTDGFQ